MSEWGQTDLKIQWVPNSRINERTELCRALSAEETGKALAFHKSFPNYSPTPLADLKAAAEHLGVGSLYVKDESYRFGLNAFKVLGATYAMGRVLAERLGEDIGDLPHARLVSPEIRKKLGDITFYATTDGNHGAAVAWTARELGQKSVIYMPKGSSPARLENIRQYGAQASITELNYDDGVRFAQAQAVKTGGVMIQDTAWEGYEKIPLWIMQGYATLAAEALSQMPQKPTHVFLQAGVGSFAGAVQGYLAALYGKEAPKVVVMEAAAADCFYRSAIAADGKARFVGGDMYTLMAGLACGEPNTLAFELLTSWSKAFVSCPDWVTAYGMRILGNPLGSDQRVVSGESGAVGMGLLASIMENSALSDLRALLDLNENSRVLLISTEGATDPGTYRDIVWRCRNAY